MNFDRRLENVLLVDSLVMIVDSKSKDSLGFFLAHDELIKVFHQFAWCKFAVFTNLTLCIFLGFINKKSMCQLDAFIADKKVTSL